MLKAEVIFITSLKASVTVFLSVSLSVCHRYLQMTNPDKVFGKLWLCVLLIIIETKITVKRQLEMTWACPSILSASGQCWIENLWKLYQFGIQLKDQTHFLSICWQCWYDFLCNLIHFTQGIANVSSVYLQLKFMTEKSVQTFGRKVIFIDILLM